MSINEILSSLSTHMIQGTMVHEQLMNCYLFLGLEGYAACHEYHYLSESKGRIKLCKYAARHFSTVIKSGKVSDPEIIPSSWFDTYRENVNSQARKEAMRAALNEWLKWEEETLALYEECYSELLSNTKPSFSEFLVPYIKDVDEELAFIKEEILHKTAMDFDIVSILEEQDTYKKKFKKLMKK